MIDDDPDPGTDPLAGRDPHPRVQIDLWPLHDARQELLEEIVSQPGAGKAAAPSTRRFLVPVGIAAAIALIAGAGWLVFADDSVKSDDQVIASTDSQADASDGGTDDSPESGTDPTDAATEPSEPEITPISDLRKGDVLSPAQCRKLRHGRLRSGLELTIEGLEDRLEQLSYVVRLSRKDARHRGVRTGRPPVWMIRVAHNEGKRWVSVDKTCTVVSVDRVPKLVAR